MIKKILFLLIIFGAVSFATNFNSCGTFATSDTYDLTGNIQVNGSCLTVAIPIATSRTIIDCHGYTIQGNYTNATSGITYIGSDDVTLQNCIIKDFGANLITTTGNNLLFQNNTFDNSSFSNIQLCTSSLCNNLTFINNTVSNGFNNGLEIYGLNNSIFNNNSCFLHEHGHGTDRCFHLDRNIYNSEFGYNYLWNNTIGFRSNNINVSNVTIHHNQILNVTAQGLNQQATAGTFDHFNFSDNQITGANGSIGFDLTFPASSTKESDCEQYIIINNTVTGGDFVFLNASNSSTSITGLNIGGMALCNADNLQISNVNLQGGQNGRNAIESMYVNNLSLFNLSAWNPYTALRGLIVNDSSFDTIQVVGSQIGAINFAGGTSSRNNLTNIFISGIPANTAISMGGVGNYVSNFHISDSNTSGWVIGFQSSTTAINNTFDRFDIENTQVGIGITNVGSGNIIKNGFIKNVTTAFFINSTATGTKTITLENITLSDATESHSTHFDLFDTISPSEIFYLSLPDSVPSFTNSSYIDVQAYLNRTSVGSANVSTDQLNISISEVPLEFSRLSWWINNGTSWSEQGGVINDGNGKLTYNGVKAYPIGTSYLDAIFYYDMCPVINQSGYIVALQNYSGAPNPITGLSSACVVINASNVQFDCQNPITTEKSWITNDGSASATGIYIPIGVQNVSVSNCGVQQYYYGGYSVNNQNNSFFSNNFFNNTITGLYLDSSDSSTFYNNTFNLNQIGLELAFSDDGNYIAQNFFVNNSIRALMVGSSNSNTIDNNTFESNNIAITLQSALSSMLTLNNFLNSGYQAVQGYSSSDTTFQNNIWQSNYVGFDGSSDNNLRFENNFLNYSNGGGSFYLSGSNNLSFQNNQFINGRTCNLCVDTSTDVNIYNNTILDAGRNLGYSAPNLQYSGNNFNIENNVILNASSVNVDSNAVNSTIRNNTIGYSTYGIYLNAGSQINIERNNFVFGDTGIAFDTYSQAVIFNNSFSDQQSQNVLMFSSPSNILFDSNSFIINSAPNINFGGATMSNVSLVNNNFTSLSDNIYLDSSSGLYASANRFVGLNSGVRVRPSSTNNNFENNIFLGCGYGILTEGGSNNQFNFNNVSSSTISGIRLSSGSSNSFNSNNIFSNPQGLVIATGNNTSGSNNHFYNNQYAFYVDTSVNPRQFNLTNSVFDSNGSFVDYSNVSIYDDALTSDVYFVNWTSAPVPPPLLPLNTTSVGNKYLNIFNITNALDINEAVFYWDSSESANETRFKVMVYEGGSWNDINQTLDTSNNRIILGANINGTYALLDNQSYTPPSPPSPSTGGSGFSLPLLTQNGTNGTFENLGLNNDSGVRLTLEDLKNPYCCIPIFILLVLVYIVIKRR